MAVNGGIGFKVSNAVATVRFTAKVYYYVIISTIQPLTKVQPNGVQLAERLNGGNDEYASGDFYVLMDRKLNTLLRAIDD
jgi:hypothetical protein